MPKLEYEYEHVRILREALARCANHAPKGVAKGAFEALRKFANGVGPYCTHPERVRVGDHMICVDCGQKKEE